MYAEAAWTPRGTWLSTEPEKVFEVTVVMRRITIRYGVADASCNLIVV